MGTAARLDVTLASLTTAQVRQPSITLRLAGRRCTKVVRVRTSQAYGSSGIAGGTVVLRNPPAEPQEGDAITWTWGFQGVEVPGFTGYVTRIIDNSYPATWELEVQDVLWLAQREQGPIAGGAAPYNDIEAGAAIAYILNAVGITRIDLPTIARPSTGGTWTLGTLTPVYWDRTTALAAAQEICATAGYWLYADAGGTVRAVAIERRPSSAAFRTFQRGVDLLLEGAPQRTKDPSQVRNRVTVRGAATGVEGAQLFDTFSATHAVYPGVTTDLEVEYALLEDIADVTAVATRLTALWNRRPSAITARIKADPRLRVGMTVAIQDSGIGHSSAQNYFLYGLDTEFDGTVGRFDQRLTLDGGTGSSGFTEIPPPVAVIQVRILERETLSSGDAISVLEVDGSGSSDATGEIVSYAWSIADTPYGGSASSATGVRATFIIADTEAPFSVTLTVTATSSKTGTTTVDVPLAGDAGVTVSTEAVIAAAGSAIEYTPDGGATWRAEVLTATIAAESAGVWATAPTTDAATYGALFTSDDDVRQTLDGLATTSTLLNTASGSITALHTNARNGARVWRAIGTTVQRSVDGGATWTTTGTAAASVRQIIEDPALDNSIFILAGANVYNSTSGGAGGFATLYAGPSGATARWMVRSDDGTITWVCYTGTFTGAPIARIEGASVTWSTSAPTEVRALALVQTDPANPVLVAVDAASPPKVWIGSATTGAMTAGPTLPSGSTAQHATGSRQFPGAYIADFDSVASGTGAIRKVLTGQSTGVLLPLWRSGTTGRQYHMVQLAAPGTSGTGKIYMLPAQTGSNNKLWIYDVQAGTWTSKALPETDITTWYAVTASRFNPRYLLLEKWEWNTVTVTGNSTIYVSTDEGDTWTKVFDETVRRDLYRYRAPAQWSLQSGERWIGIWHSTTPTNRLLRGTLTGYTTTSISTLERFHATPVLNNEALVHGLDSPNIRRVLDGGTVSTSVASGFETAVDTLYATPPDSAKTVQAYYVSSLTGTLKIATDYRSGSASTLIGTAASGGWSVAVLADETVIIGGRASIREIPDAWGSGSVSDVYTTNVGWVRADAQTQTLAAAVDTTAGEDNVIPLVRDPATGVWRTIARPSGVEFVNWIEIVNTGG